MKLFLSVHTIASARVLQMSSDGPVGAAHPERWGWAGLSLKNSTWDERLAPVQQCLIYLQWFCFDCLHICIKPPWPNGQGVGLLIRRLRVRVPQEVLVVSNGAAAQTPSLS